MAAGRGGPQCNREGLDHTLAAGALPGPHRDPFDRMLIAQSRIEKLQLVSRDAVFAEYASDVLW